MGRSTLTAVNFNQTALRDQSLTRLLCGQTTLPACIARPLSPRSSNSRASPKGALMKDVMTNSLLCQMHTSTFRKLLGSGKGNPYEKKITESKSRYFHNRVDLFYKFPQRSACESRGNGLTDLIDISLSLLLRCLNPMEVVVLPACCL